MMEAKVLKVSEIHPSPDNIRHQIGRLKELKQSIEAVGLLQPIVVTKNTEGYAIVAGHRRFAAIQELGWTEIDVVVREFDDADKIEAMIVENFHREDLSPIEQAEGLFALEQLGLDRKVIAEKTGLSGKLVRERIKLLDLPKRGQDLIHKGQLSLDAGLELAKLATDPDLVTQVVEALDAGEGRSDVNYWVSQVRRTREQAEGQAKLEGLVAKLREQGREVVEAEPDPRDYYTGFTNPPGAWKEILEADDSSYRQGLRLGAKAHGKEECAVWWYRPAAKHYGASLEQRCKKPSRHTFTGDSDLKIPDAESAHKDTEKERRQKAKDRDDRKTADARYTAALTGKKPPRAVAFSLAVRGFVHDTWAENRKQACKLLGITTEGYNGDRDALLTLVETDPERVVMALYLVKADPLGPKYRAGGDEFRPIYEEAVALIPEVEA